MSTVPVRSLISSGERANRTLSLRANISWSFVGSSYYAICQWGMLIVLARMGSPEMVGQFALALAFTAPVMMFSSLQLRGLQATDARSEFCLRDYLSLRLLTTGGALVVIVGIAASLGMGSTLALLVLTVGGAKAIEAISDILHGSLQKNERMDHVASSLFLRGSLSVVAIAIGLWISGSLLVGTMLLGLVWGLVLVGYDFPCAARFVRDSNALSPRWQFHRLATMSALALPLGIVGGTISLQVHLPRFFVGFHLGNRELGIFFALVAFLLAAQLLIRAVNQSSLVKLSQFFSQGRIDRFTHLVKRLMFVGLLCGSSAILIAAFAGRLLLSVVYGEEYAEYRDLFLWLMVAWAGGFIVRPMMIAVRAMRYFWHQVAVQVASVVVLLIACMVFIPRFGIIGAAYAGLVAIAVQAVGYAFVLRHLMRKEMNRHNARKTHTGFYPG